MTSETLQNLTHQPGDLEHRRDANPRSSSSGAGRRRCTGDRSADVVRGGCETATGRPVQPGRACPGGEAESRPRLLRRPASHMAERGKTYRQPVDDQPGPQQLDWGIRDWLAEVVDCFGFGMRRTDNAGVERDYHEGIGELSHGVGRRGARDVRILIRRFRSCGMMGGR